MSNVKLAIPLYGWVECEGKPFYVPVDQVSFIVEGGPVLGADNTDYRIVSTVFGRAFYTRMSLDQLCDLLGWATFTEDPRG